MGLSALARRRAVLAGPTVPVWRWANNISAAGDKVNATEVNKRRLEFNVTRDLLSYMPGRMWAEAQLADPPAPDIVIPERGIGVEVTRIYPGGEPLRRREGSQDAILALAAQCYRASGAPPVDVLVSWSGYSDPPATRKQAAANALASFIRANLPEPNGVVEFNAAADERIQLPHAIDSLSIGRFVHQGAVGDTNHWHTPRSAFRSAIPQGVIQARLDAKDRKLAQWSAEYSEVWLLLSFNREGPSSWGHLPADLLGQQFRTSAKRVFVLGRPDEILELSLIRGA